MLNFRLVVMRRRDFARVKATELVEEWQQVKDKASQSSLEFLKTKKYTRTHDAYEQLYSKEVFRNHQVKEAGFHGVQDLFYQWSGKQHKHQLLRVDLSTAPLFVQYL